MSDILDDLPVQILEHILLALPVDRILCFLSSSNELIRYAALKIMFQKVKIKDPKSTIGEEIKNERI